MRGNCRLLIIESSNKNVHSIYFHISPQEAMKIQTPLIYEPNFHHFKFENYNLSDKVILYLDEFKKTLLQKSHLLVIVERFYINITKKNKH